MTRSEGLFEFTWTQAFPSQGWVGREYKLEKQVVTTVGWVLQQDRDYMVVARDYNPMTDLYLMVVAIPRACIIKTREVETEDESST